MFDSVSIIDAFVIVSITLLFTYVFITILVPKLFFNVRSPKFSLPRQNDVVVVTGASRGIGKSCAISLLREGFRVYAGVRSKSSGERLVTECGGDPNMIPLMLDVADSKSIQTAYEVVSSRNPDGIFGLVNNAGINVGPFPVEGIDMKSMRKQYDVNVFGQVEVTKAFLSLIRKRGGRVVFMSSVAGSISTAFGGVYASSKFAIEAVADALRREMVPWNVSVSVVKPGELKSDLLDKYQEDGQRVMKSLSSDCKRFYGDYYRNMKPTRDKYVGKVELASRAVVKSLSSSRPKTRYVVGSKAMIKSHLRPFKAFGISLPVWSLLPDRYLDKQMRRVWPKRYSVPKE